MSHFLALFIVSCSWTRHRRNGLYPEVELGLTGLTSTSQNVRRTFYVLSVVSVQCFSPDVYHRILCSWTRHRRNGVRFPKYPHGCPSRLRYSGPTFHFWARWLVSCSWTRKSRNGVHFPESAAERFTFFASLRSSVPFLNAFPRILSFIYCFDG